MRPIETPWGRKLPFEVVKIFLELQTGEVKKKSEALRTLLFQLWVVSPKDGEIASFIVLKHRLPSPLRELAGEILIRGPVVERMVVEIENATKLEHLLSVTKEGDDLLFNLKEKEEGMLSLSLLWRRIGDSFSVPARVDDFIREIINSEYLPGLRAPFVLSAMRRLSERAEWLAPKVFAGIREVTLIRRAKPSRQEETKH